LTDIQVIQRVTDILNVFTADAPAVRLGPLARELDMQRSTLHRYLSSMANAGLLVRGVDNTFRLGPVAARLGTLALNVGLEPETLTAAMNALCVATRLTVVRSVWNELAPVVIQTVIPDTPTHVSVKVGTRLPLTAAQMVIFLAFDQGIDKRDQLLSLLSDQERSQLEQSIEFAESHGITIGGRVSSGVRAIATPILGPEGHAVMSLALIGTTVTVPDSPFSKEARLLADTAATLSQLMGYSGAHPAQEFVSDEGLRAI
jgi:DNA-binding IclR family transcriptional regulator